MESDIVILGAGAAGIMCAIEAGKRNRKVILLDHSRKWVKKSVFQEEGDVILQTSMFRPVTLFHKIPIFVFQHLKDTPHKISSK